MDRSVVAQAKACEGVYSHQMRRKNATRNTLQSAINRRKEALQKPWGAEYRAEWASRKGLVGMPKKS
jgi:hypothetical protein